MDILLSSIKATSRDLNYFTFLLVGELCFFATQDWPRFTEMVVV